MTNRICATSSGGAVSFYAAVSYIHTYIHIYTYVYLYIYGHTR